MNSSPASESRRCCHQCRDSQAGHRRCRGGDRASRSRPSPAPPATARCSRRSGAPLRLQSFSRVVARVQIGKRLAVGVADDVTARNGVYERQTQSKACSLQSVIGRCARRDPVGDCRQVDGVQARHRCRENLALIEGGKPVAESRSRRQIPGSSRVARCRGLLEA